MTVVGQPHVSNTGAFTYSIPITIPPGTAGLAPSLSLSYSSQNGDGFVGLGWALNGLPAITRCPRIAAVDGTHGSVNYDSNDRFCLNGQELTLVSGSYGADGSQYRTISESFSEIIAHGTAGNGPKWFEVHLRTGQELIFGDNSSAEVLAVGSPTVRAWMVNNLSDTKGNYYTVTYNSASSSDRTANGEVYPVKIQYTGNTAAGVSGPNSITFTYSTRSDVVPLYQAGSIIQNTVLLTDIKTYTGTTLVEDYQLGYQPASSTASHDELTSLNVCDGAGTNCFAPMTFGWQGSRDAPTMSSTANSLAQGVTLLAGDFNGDGLTDAMIFDPNRQYSQGCPTGGTIFTGSQAGTFSAGNFGAIYDFAPFVTGETNYVGPFCILGNLDAVPFVYDLNGDGFTDVLFYEGAYPPPGGTEQEISTVLLNNAGGTLVEPSANQPLPAPWQMADFNGDGYIDGYSPGAITFGDGDGTFYGLSPAAVAVALDATSTTYVGDFNGDGCADLLAQGGANKVVYSSCAPAVTTATISNFGSSSKIITGDFNGDGMTDILVVTSSGATLYLSTGTGFAAGISVGSSSWHDYNIITGDWNGDGKTDVALLSQSAGGTHHIYLSTGTGFMSLTTIANSDTSPTAVVADWNNDGADDLWMQKASGDTEYLFAYTPELMTSVANGVGATTTITYDRLNHSSYTKGTSSAYPQKDYDGAAYVTTKVGTSDGIGSVHTLEYTYTGAVADITQPPFPGPKSNLLTAGFNTFTTMTAKDERSLVTARTTFSTTSPYIGTVSAQKIYQGSSTFKTVANTYSSTSLPNNANYVFLQKSVVNSYETDGTALPAVTTAYTYDTYGNALTITRSVSDGSSKTITNTYNNDTTNWILGEILTKRINSIVGSSNVTRGFSYTHDSSSGLVTSKIAEPSSSTMKLETDIGYDGFGNATSETQSGSGITSRTSSVTYDSNGQFPTGTSNALSQSQTLSFGAAFGEVGSVTDINSRTTTLSYDTLGRITLAVKPDGNQTAISYAYCSGVNGGSKSCPSRGAYAAVATPENASGAQNGALNTTYYDMLGRVIANDKQGFDGSNIRVLTTYDNVGHVATTSRPFFVSGGTAELTTYSYTDAQGGVDPFGRAWQVTFPDGSSTTYSYTALTKTVTNNASQATTYVENAQGLLASVTDNLGHVSSFVYDAFGNVLTSTDTAGNVITNTFDVRGRKTATSDPDMGSWSYSYDALSELTSQTDAKSQTTTLTYDVLGRPKTRTEADLTSYWSYDSSTNGVGLPHESCIGSPCSSGNYTHELLYDTDGRVSTDKYFLDGAASVSYNITYDANGRIATVGYPSGFTAEYFYNAKGYLYEIADQSSGTALWTANTADADLHVTQATAGNNVVSTAAFDAETGHLLNISASNDGSNDGSVANLSYTWDTIGNLIERDDTVEGYAEKFCYDGINRLQDYSLNSTCTTGPYSRVSYGGQGNVERKSDICNTDNCISYGAGAPGPHAVTAISGTFNGTTNPSFTYDANGNMTGGAGRSFTWTSYNMASKVTQGSNALTFVYGPEHQRYKQCVPNCTSPTSTVYYLNDPTSGMGSEEYVSGSNTVWHDYVVAPGQGIVAVRTNNGGTISWRYLLNDHLGSTTVLTNTASPHGQVVERDSYDAWGNRRNANGNDSSTCSLTSQTSRGYTGQEMLDTFCLVDLNARLYDPRLARFLSPDSMVPDPANTQSYNRYSYTNNNPLNAIDPTGHMIIVECDADCTSSGGVGSGLDGFGDDTGDDGSFTFGGYTYTPSGDGYIVHTGPGSSVTSAGPGSTETVTVTCQCFWEPGLGGLGAFPTVGLTPYGTNGISSTLSGLVGSLGDAIRSSVSTPSGKSFVNGLAALGQQMQSDAKTGLTVGVGITVAGALTAQPEGVAVGVGLVGASGFVGDVGVGISGVASFLQSMQQGDQGPLNQWIPDALEPSPEVPGHD